MKNRNIINLFGFVATIALLLLTLAPPVSAGGFAETHGNAQFITYEIKQRSDSHGNTLKVVIDTYEDPDYPMSPYGVALLYTLKVYQSPADHHNWGLKDGNNDHHTVTIKMYNPKSGDSQSRIDSYLPNSIIKEEYGGTVTYGFAISGGESVQVLGAGAHLDVQSYISWTIPVYYYTLKPVRMTNEEFKVVGDITGDYNTARYYTASVSVPYLSAGGQNIQVYIEGRYHQWTWLGPDSTIRISFTFGSTANEIPI